MLERKVHSIIYPQGLFAGTEMTTTLIDLNDRIVTDTGSVVAKYDLLLHKALSGEVFTDIPCVDHPDVRLYARRAGKRMKIWSDDGNVKGPPERAYEWKIPQEYQDIDLTELCVEIAEGQGYDSEEYIDRLTAELERIEQKQMEPFLKCLVYITDTFREKGIIWGVGRGSSCASLVLYLLGVNKVDPVKYDIPMEEFYK